MILFAKSMIKLEEKINTFLRDRKSLKGVLVKPRLCMKVFKAQIEGTQRICSILPGIH